jgi:hypothetical protein
MKFLKVSVFTILLMLTAAQCFAENQGQAEGMRDDALDAKALALQYQGLAATKSDELCDETLEFEIYVGDELIGLMEEANWTQQQIDTEIADIENRIESGPWFHYGRGEGFMDNGAEALAKAERLMSSEAPNGDFPGGYAYFAGLGLWTDAYDAAASAKSYYNISKYWYTDAWYAFGTSGLVSLDDIESEVRAYF